MNVDKPNTANEPTLATLPPILDFKALKSNFGIGRTTAYYLASMGEIVSLTTGIPGKRGKRVFLTDSVIAYIRRRATESTTLKCSVK